MLVAALRLSRHLRHAIFTCFSMANDEKKKKSQSPLFLNENSHSHRVINWVTAEDCRREIAKSPLNSLTLNFA